MATNARGVGNMQSRVASRAVAAGIAAYVSFSLCACSVPSLPGLPKASYPSVAEATASLSSGKTATVDDSALVSPGTLTVGVRTGAVSAPVLVEAQDGSLSGLDVDLASAIADEMGLKVRFVGVSTVSDSLGKTCDIVMDLSDGEASSAKVVGTYAESATAFFHKGDTGIAKVGDLSSKTVGLQDGSMSQRALENTGLVMSEKTYSNLNDAFSALEGGQIDYVLCDACSGAYLASQYDDIAFVGTLDAAKTYGVAVSSSNAQLEDAVQSAYDAVSSNGVYDLVRSRWLGGMAQLGTQNQVQGVPESSGDATSLSGDSSDASSATSQASLTGVGTGAVSVANL